MDFTASWHWPQWFFVIWFFLSITVSASLNGDEKIISTGPRKGQPERHNFAFATVKLAMFLFVLIAGGFFE